jgi:hypothetical protein
MSLSISQESLTGNMSKTHSGFFDVASIVEPYTMKVGHFWQWAQYLDRRDQPRIFVNHVSIDFTPSPL